MSADQDRQSVVAIGDVKAGTLLVTDGGFTCMGDHDLKLVKAEADGSLYVDCKDGHHGLDGQECSAGEHGVDFDHYIGFWLEGQEPPVTLIDKFKALLRQGLAQAEVLNALNEESEDTPNYQDAIATAREQTNDDLEIDDKPLLSPGDEGCWVSAWIWVPAPEIEDVEEEDNDGQ